MDVVESNKVMSEENYEQITGVCNPPDAKEDDQVFSLSVMIAQLNFLLGDTLTVIDASIADPIQRKAMKDIVKQKFWDKCNHLADIVYQNGRCSIPLNEKEVL